MTRLTRSTHDALHLTAAEFTQLSASYCRQWPVRLLAALVDGTVVFSEAGRVDRSPGPTQVARRHAIAEALRWGEATIVEYPGNQLVWAVPIMHNARLLGGLLAIAREQDVFGSPDGQSGSTRVGRFDVRQACTALRLLAEGANLTNAALLAQRREEYDREQKRAEAIQDLKTRYFYSIREVYLREEPALVSAVRKNDRREARGILNRILVVIYSLGGSNLSLIKSFLMELVVTMCRTAVESGGDPRQLLGANYASISELSAINSEVELSRWLVGMLERIMDSIQHHRRQPSAALLQAAMKYLAEHYAEDIGRNDVARVANLSPPHFSRLFRRAVGRGFNDMLNQLRIDRAAELLRSTDRGLLQVALDVGFNDQSYFTKVFRKYMKSSPREYRQRQMPPAE